MKNSQETESFTQWGIQLAKGLEVLEIIVDGAWMKCFV